MKSVKLEAFKDENTGEIGLGLLRMARNENTNAAMEGLLIAHDLIEHVNGAAAIGGIDDELEALGGIWYTRGQHSDLTRNGAGSHYTIAENIASDITRMFRDHIDGAQYVTLDIGHSRPCFLDDQLQQTLRDADASYMGEIDDEGRERARLVWPAYRAAALFRMRLGVRKSRKRWEGRDGSRFAANSQFWAIAEAIDSATKHTDMYEGARFVLRYGDGEATCEETYID